MNDVARLLRQAVARHQAGDLAGAAAGYQAVLAEAPNQADALHLLGVVKDEQGDHAAAVEVRVGPVVSLVPHALRLLTDLVLFLG